MSASTSACRSSSFKAGIKALDFATHFQELVRYSIAHSCRVSRQSTAKEGDTMVSLRNPRFASILSVSSVGCSQTTDPNRDW